MINMKRIFWIVCCVFWSISSVWGQNKQAKHLFVDMPDLLCLLLTGVNRADCVDFLESNMKARVTNRFNEQTEMTELSSDFIRLQLTSKNSWQMKVLPVNDSLQVICTVSTCCAPVCDSEIHFYDTEWKELDSSGYLENFPLSIYDFISQTPPENTEFSKWIKALDMLLVQLDLNGKDQKLSVYFTTPDYVDKETAEKLEPYLCRLKTMVWCAGKFRPDTGL